MDEPGQIVILNGTPRSGKSSIAAAVQDELAGVWMNIGVDRLMAMTPARYQPGIGLRPGGERPDLEPLVVRLYGAMYESIAAHARMGINVVTDVGHHDDYSTPRSILAGCLRRLGDLPVLLVGVRCPIEVIMRRRVDTWNAQFNPGDPIPAPVQRWQTAVHEPGIYDLEVDSSRLSPLESVAAIRGRLDSGVPPTAAERVIAHGG